MHDGTGGLFFFKLAKLGDDGEQQQGGGGAEEEDEEPWGIGAVRRHGHSCDTPTQLDPRRYYGHTCIDMVTMCRPYLKSL
jgi:hypothetical protein